jgi:RNA polymerase sigma-70 factor (ECF subfamily)
VRDAHKNVSDAELLRRARRKDFAAFNSLFYRYRDRILRYVARFVKPDNAEDVLQEAFLLVYSRAEQYDPRWSAATWIYAIARNCSLKFLRKQRASHTVPMPDAVELLAEFAGGTDPADATVEADTEERIREAIRLMPPKERECLQLRRYKGLNYREIASACGCSERTVKTRLDNAGIFLAQRLTEIGILAAR